MEVASGETLKPDALTLGTIAFVVIFPSTLAYMFYNRGIELIGPNRAAPFFHLCRCRLGHGDRLPRREAGAVPPGRLRAGDRRHLHRVAALRHESAVGPAAFRISV